MATETPNGGEYEKNVIFDQWLTFSRK